MRLFEKDRMTKTQFHKSYDPFQLMSKLLADGDLLLAAEKLKEIHDQILASDSTATNPILMMENNFDEYTFNITYQRDETDRELKNRLKYREKIKNDAKRNHERIDTDEIKRLKELAGKHGFNVSKRG